MILFLVLSALPATAQSEPGSDGEPVSAPAEEVPLADVFPRSWPELPWPPGVDPKSRVTLRVTSRQDGLVVDMEVIGAGPGRLITAARKAAMRLQLVGEDGVPAAGVWIWEASFDDAVSETFDVVDRTPWRPRETGGRLVDMPAGSWRMGGGDIEEMSGAGADVSRALQALPGVQAPQLRSTALSLHAAEPGEVLWTVEGVPLAAPRSVGTIFSRVPQMAVEAVDVRMAESRADISGVVAGSVDLTLVDPDDREWDGTVEMTPALLQAQVATPIGPRERGNAILVGLRRSWLEPSLQLLEAVGAGQSWSFRTSDFVSRIRLEPGQNQRVDLILLSGRTRNIAEGADPELQPVDIGGSNLGILRHRWRIAPGVRLEQRFSLTREVGEVSSDFESRRDVRTRPAFRSMADLGQDTNLLKGALGFEMARTDVRGEGTLLDPRIAPAWTRVAWRRLDPPLFDLNVRTGWTETAGFGRARIKRGMWTARVGLRGSHFAWIDQENEDAGALAWAGTAALSADLPTGTQLSALISRGRQRPRDVLSLDPIPSLKAFDLPRSWNGVLSARQALGEVGVARVDLWARAMGGVAAWDWTRAPHQTVFEGRERAAGADLLVAGRWKRTQAGLTASLADARRTGPDGIPRRPDVLVPWSVQVHGGWRPDGEAGWRIEGRVQVRAGVEQVPLVASVADGEVVYTANFDERERLAPRWRAAARASRRVVIADRVSLAVWGEMLVSGGPLGERLVGAEVGEDGELVEPSTVAVRDPVLLPWAGVRARF